MQNKSDVECTFFQPHITYQMKANYCSAQNHAMWVADVSVFTAKRKLLNWARWRSQPRHV